MSSNTPSHSHSEEITAIKTILDTLEEFDETSRNRIFDYVRSRLGLSVSLRHSAQVADSTPHSAIPSQDGCEFGNLAELMNAANPKSQRQNALGAAYWIQVCEDQSDGFLASDIKKALTDSGHKLANPTRTLKELTKGTDAFILQVKKRGKGKTAAIVFKLSATGREAVEKMIYGQE